MDGFLAKTQAEELSGDPNMQVFVTEDIRDVTNEVNARSSNTMGGVERYKVIERAIKEQIKGCESGGYRCDVYSFQGGFSYQLIKQLEIKDVRVV